MPFQRDASGGPAVGAPPPLVSLTGERRVRSRLRQLLFRLGLTGKLLFHFGWILALSIGLLVGLAHVRARATIRDELRKMELVRMERWATKHHRILEEDDRWRIAGAVEELLGDPYVVYAAVFDRTGQAVAQTGDREAYLQPHSLRLVARLRRGFPGEGRPFEEVTPPLPGVSGSAGEGGGPARFDERLRTVLDAAGLAGEDHLGFIEVDLSTAPLVSLANRVLWPLLLLAVAFFGAGLAITWALLRRVTAPLRMLREKSDLIAQGRLDETFDAVPRPPDEVGDLATHFSVMVGQIRRARERLEEEVRAREAGLREESRRLEKIAHDLKNPIASILAFAEILQDAGTADETERHRFLGMIRSESRRLTGILDSLPGRVAEAGPAPGGDEARGEGPRRILVALTDPDLRSFLREELRRDGYEVLESSDAASTLRRAREERPDAVLLDLLFDGGEGVRALGELERGGLSRRTEVLPLALTGHEGRYAAAALYLHAKPVEREALLESIGEASAAVNKKVSRILVVDDDRFVAEGLRATLEREGFRVEIAAGGEQGLKAAEAEPPDLLVVDLAMPGLDGAQLVRRLRARSATRATPVILITGDDVPRRSAISWQEVLIDRETVANGIRSALKETTER